MKVIYKLYNLYIIFFFIFFNELDADLSGCFFMTAQRKENFYIKSMLF